MSAATSSKNAIKSAPPKTLIAGVPAVVVLLVVSLIMAINLTLQSDAASEKVLVDSIEAELVAGTAGAREIVSENIDLFMKINSQEDVEKYWEEWLEVTNELRLLRDEINGQYIYALKEIDGVYYFVFDTDEEAQASQSIFTSYTLSPVHEDAFAGKPSAGVMNVVDEWGSYNTGALPLFDNSGKQVGIVATDITDTFVQRSREATGFYSTALIVSLSSAALLMLVILFVLARSNSAMQKHLYRLANFDPISGLPNRNNLFSFLASEIDHLKDRSHSFAVVFIDLDNFKLVNDASGHGAGDHLLHKIATLLSCYVQSSPYAFANGMAALTSRIGGDEFLQIVPNVSSSAKALEYAQGLLEAFGKEPDLQRFIDDFGIGLSIGVALFPSMETEYDALVRFADIAMYHAKRSGKNSVKLYDPSMGDDIEGAALTVRSRRAKGKEAP